MVALRWVVAGAGLLIGSPFVAAQGPAARPAGDLGRAVFETKCVACHSLGHDRLVGPGLAGVTASRSRDWLTRWIAAPDRLLSAGDSLARRLLAESNDVPMPNLGLSPADVNAVIAYLGKPAAPGFGPWLTPEPPPPGPPGDATLGRALFEGASEFANHGPPCNSCHEVRDDSVSGGGALGRELTAAYSRLGGGGISSILSGPPFPVMARAYQDKPFTKGEIAALVSFLRRADERQASQQPRSYSLRLLGAGFGGTALLLVLYSLVWSGRLRGSVNQRIYDRQTKST
jgi:mono/diheme cytochrome c family protein